MNRSGLSYSLETYSVTVRRRWINGSAGKGHLPMNVAMAFNTVLARLQKEKWMELSILQEHVRKLAILPCVVKTPLSRYAVPREEI